MTYPPGPSVAPVRPASGGASARPKGAACGPEGPRSYLTQDSYAAPDAEMLTRARWASKYEAAKILRKQSDAKLSRLGVRVSHCGYVAHRSFVDLERNGQTGKAGFRGLKTCANLWVCPVCSGRISRRRQDELNRLLQAARQAGHSALLLTQTFQHKRGDVLSAILDRFKVAQRKWRNRRDWAALKGQIIGTVSALELTWSPNAHWHPHAHILLIVKAPAAAAYKLVNGLRAGWLASLDGAGLHGGKAAWQLQDASAAGAYVAKWGAGEEMALHGAKSGRNGARTPFAILADARDGCARSGALFAEYAAAMVGRRQLVWSNGLKALFGIDDVPDDQAAQEAEPDAVPTLETLRTWAASGDWRNARRRRVALVQAAQAGGDLDAAEFGPTDAEIWWVHAQGSAVLEPPE
jgi:Replication protein.